MIIPKKKLKSGLEMPVFGLGTYGIGGKLENNSFNNNKRDLDIIKSAIELGITHIDTAELYANGVAEELIGQAIKKYKREQLFLASKVKKEHLNYDDIKFAAKESLRRLQTEYLDLYFLHNFPGGKLEECLLAMNELVVDGVIRNIGLSNFNLAHTKIAKALSINPIVATQVHYNLQFREAEAEGLVNFCQQNDMFLIAWRPLNLAIYNKTNIDLTKFGISVLDEICQKYGKTPAQIAINWLISQENVITISKTSNIHHLKENLGGVGWKLSKKDIEKLRKEFPNQQFISNIQPLK